MGGECLSAHLFTFHYSLNRRPTVCTGVVQAKPTGGCGILPYGCISVTGGKSVGVGILDDPRWVRKICGCAEKSLRVLQSKTHLPLAREDLLSFSATPFSKGALLKPSLLKVAQRRRGNEWQSGGLPEPRRDRAAARRKNFRSENSGRIFREGHEKHANSWRSIHESTLRRAEGTPFTYSLFTIH